MGMSAYTRSMLQIMKLEATPGFDATASGSDFGPWCAIQERGAGGGGGMQAEADAQVEK